MKIINLKIDPKSKYIFIVSHDKDPNLMRESLIDLEKHLTNWWNSDEKFCIISVMSDIKVEIERLEND